MTSDSEQNAASSAEPNGGSPKAQPPRRAGLRSRVLLSAVTLVVLVLVAEVVVRTLVPRDRFLSWDELDDHMKTARLAEGVLQVDQALGHRPVFGGKDYDAEGILHHSRKHSTGSSQTLFLGDSVTRRGTLIQGFREFAPEMSLWNAGVEAWCPVQEVESYLAHTRTSQPERLVLTFHNNDFAFTPVALWHGDSLAICVPGEVCEFWPDAYKLSWLYRLWVNARHPKLHALPDAQGMLPMVESSMGQLRDSAREDGIEFDVLLLPLFAPLSEWDESERQSREMAIALFERLGLRWIDLLEPIAQMFDAGLVVQVMEGDRWHPNSEAGQLMAFHALQQGLFKDWDGQLRTDRYAIVGDGRQEQELRFDAGPEYAGMPYRVLGSALGRGKGIELQGTRLPLMPDGYMAKTLWESETVMEGGAGTLDEEGRAVIRVRGPDMSRASEPVPLYHLAVVYDDADRIVLASNIAPLVIAAP